MLDQTSVRVDMGRSSCGISPITLLGYDLPHEIVPVAFGFVRTSFVGGPAFSKQRKKRGLARRSYAALFPFFAFGWCFQRRCSQKYCSG